MGIFYEGNWNYIEGEPLVDFYFKQSFYSFIYKMMKDTDIEIPKEFSIFNDPDSIFGKLYIDLKDMTDDILEIGRGRRWGKLRGVTQKYLNHLIKIMHNFYINYGYKSEHDLAFTYFLNGNNNIDNFIIVLLTVMHVNRYDRDRYDDMINHIKRELYSPYREKLAQEFLSTELDINIKKKEEDLL